MGFLAPLFLAGIAAAAIPIALHLFHRRPEPVVEFAAMRYLRRVSVADSRARRLREWLLLALRVSALLLLAFAFARPYFPQAAALAAPATVILIDTSASLSAPGHFERTRSLAHAAIREAPLSHIVGVAAFGTGVDVVAPLAGDRARAHAAVDALTAGAGATRYSAALAGAADLLGDRPGRIVVITDLQETGWDGPDGTGIPADVEVMVQDAGIPSGNIAVASLAIEEDEAVAVVQNFSSDDAPGQVTFRVDSRPAGAVLVHVPRRATAEARVRLPRRATTDAAYAIEATVTDRGGFAADNTRYAVRDPAVAPSVLAVTNTGQPSDAFYFHRAATVGDGPAGFRFTSIDGAALSRLDDDALGAFDVVAILGSRGLRQEVRERLASYVRGGGGLLLTAGPDVDPGAMARVLNDVVGTTWSVRGDQTLAFAPDDSRHPVFRAVGGAATLGNVAFRRAVAVNAGDGASVVARYSDGTPALVEEQVGDGRVLLLASDLNGRWNNFPLQPAFVPFVHELLRYLAGSRAGRSEFLVGEIPGAAGTTPGVVTHAGRLIAVNVDPREFDPARVTADAFMAGVDRLTTAGARRVETETREREDGQRLWQFALALMLVSLAAEGMVGRRVG